MAHAKVLSDKEEEYIKKAVFVEHVPVTEMTFCVLLARMAANDSDKFFAEVEEEGPVRIQRELTIIKHAIQGVFRGEQAKIIDKAMEITGEKPNERINMLIIKRNQVAVIPIFDPEKIGHIIVPDQARDRCDQGIVKYVGADVTDIKIGDYIAFSGYTGSLINIEGEGKLIIFDHSFAVAIMCEPETIDVPGLYFRDLQGNYWTATYEQALELCAQAFTDAGKTYFIGRNEKPTYDSITQGYK